MTSIIPEFDNELPVGQKRVSVDAITGCLLGTAVGDAVGLACEGYPRRRQRAVFGVIKGPRLLPRGRGMVSDDTEHTIMVAQALIDCGGEWPRFGQSLAREMRLWICGLPAGAGKATLQAGIRLLCGVSPQKSGVFSAGNGPAMRSALLGVCYGHDTQRLKHLVSICTRITHTDPKAAAGAFAVAWAAFRASRGGVTEPQGFLEELREHLLDGSNPSAQELVGLIEKAVVAYENGWSCSEFADSLGWQRGVSGYINHTVPVTLLAWFRYRGDMRAAVLELVHCGGDTDSTAAIAGAIIGAGCGREGVPSDWLEALWEWPRDVQWLERLAERLELSCREKNVKPLRYSRLLLVLRNLCFFLIVLVHAARRLLPPY